MTTSTLTPVKPADEELQLLLHEISKAQAERVSLELVAIYDATEIPGGYGNLGTHIYGVSGKRQVPSGHKHEKAVAANAARLAVLEDRLADFEARSQAYRAAQVANAPKETVAPTVAAGE